MKPFLYLILVRVLLVFVLFASRDTDKCPVFHSSDTCTLRLLCIASVPVSDLLGQMSVPKSTASGGDCQGRVSS